MEIQLVSMMNLKKYNIHLNNLLSVRSFLDHNRIFKMPKIKNFDLEKLKPIQLLHLVQTIIMIFMSL